MNFLALFVGLGLERLVTHLFHLREFRWLDPLFDWFLGIQRSFRPAMAVVATAAIALVVVAPVGIIELILNDRLAYIPQFAFSVVVLIFCLGPRDLGDEINDYIRALSAQNTDETREIAALLLEVSAESGDVPPDIEAAVYAQANNRIFGVVFWFVILGPSGAWLFRVLDLMRHRAAQLIRQKIAAGNDEEELPRLVQACLLLHFLIAWLPGRLLAIGYMLAGSYEGAAAAWRGHEAEPSATFPGPTDQLLGAVGKGAAAWGGADDSITGRILNARALIFRTLWMIWCPILALLTLYDFVA